MNSNFGNLWKEYHLVETILELWKFYWVVWNMDFVNRPVLLLIFIVIFVVVIYFKFCKRRKPKKLKKIDLEIESSNSDKDAAKWINNYLRNNLRMSLNPYLNPHAIESRSNINPVLEFEDWPDFLRNLGLWKIVLFLALISRRKL